MTIARAQGALIGVFLLSFFSAMGSLVYSYAVKEIYSDTLSSLLVKLVAIYSVPLAVTVGGIFGIRAANKRQYLSLPFWSAMTFTVTWNLIILWRVMMFSLSPDDSDKEFTSYLENVVPSTQFLISGVLSYYFSKST